jgi:hypothetical protein
MIGAGLSRSDAQLVLGCSITLGTEVAALYYTLYETAKLVGVDAWAYLLRALYAAIALPGAVAYPRRHYPRVDRVNTSPTSSPVVATRCSARPYGNRRPTRRRCRVDRGNCEAAEASC